MQLRYAEVSEGGLELCGLPMQPCMFNGVDILVLKFSFFLLQFYVSAVMLIKEYRIPLPLTVDEYRIAQLYMIQVSIPTYSL